MVPGHVPKELADLTNLTVLTLFANKGLEVPDGAPTEFVGMLYQNRKSVAAFQACLK